uniref:Uncharacterized protein n=1 Tax=Rhizophora mucronata TaxID=61149 RepID=A0A2P2R1L7_RHIMU
MLSTAAISSLTNCSNMYLDKSFFLSHIF